MASKINPALVDKKWGRELSEALDKNRLSTVQAARLLGASESAVCNWKRGVRVNSLQMRRRIKDVFSVTAPSKTRLSVIQRKTEQESIPETIPVSQIYHPQSEMPVINEGKRLGLITINFQDLTERMQQIEEKLDRLIALWT